jgi:hypothetical protein
MHIQMVCEFKQRNRQFSCLPLRNQLTSIMTMVVLGMICATCFFCMHTHSGYTPSSEPYRIYTKSNTALCKTGYGYLKSAVKKILLYSVFSHENVSY